MKTRLIFLGLLTAATVLHAQDADPWSRLRFLLGDWVGVAGAQDTAIGAGQGTYSFQPDLDRKIVVRRNSSTYDSGVHHDDLMVIYVDSPGSAPRAIYFDSEGHVIRYALSFPAANSAVFDSEAGQPGPKFRLTYRLEGASLNGKFEIAAPSDEYKTYMKWTSKKP
jgi:hypothetical protein